MIEYPDSVCETHRNVKTDNPVCVICMGNEIERLRILLAERNALQAEVLRLRVAMAKAAQRADDWPNSNDDPADVLSDCADTLYGALDAEQTDRGDP